MFDWKTILFSQFPACFLLAVLFLINYLTVRKRSAVKSVLWVLLFGIFLALAILCSFLGMQSKLWTLKTMFHLGVWSWIGIALVVIFLALRIAHGIEKKHNRRVMEKALKNAEREKNNAVAEAHEAGRQEAKAEAEVAANVETVMSEPAAPEAPAQNDTAEA